MTHRKALAILACLVMAGTSACGNAGAKDKQKPFRYLASGVTAHGSWFVFEGVSGDGNACLGLVSSPLRQPPSASLALKELTNNSWPDKTWTQTEAFCTFGPDRFSQMTARAASVGIESAQGPTVISAGVVPEAVMKVKLPSSVALTHEAINAPGYPKCRFFTTTDDTTTPQFTPLMANGKVYPHKWRI